MTKPATLRCWLFALALMLASPVWASRLALVIGNNAYQKVERLENARNDANLMATVLKKAGFDVTQASDLSRTALWTTIDTFKGRIQKGDEVVFYFAGHGVQIGSNQLLLPIDIVAQNDSQVQRDGVALVDVQDALKDARVAVLLLDACRDNPFPKIGTRAIGGTRGLIPPEPGTGQIIMMSAGRNQKALDRVPGELQANGLFTWELVRVIQTPGVEIRNALEQVKTAVNDKARRAGYEQRPSLVNDLTGNFYFFGPTTVQVVPPAPVAPEMTANQREDAFWNDAKAAGNREAFEAYLDSYSKGRYASLAKANVARLSAASVTPASPAVIAAQPPQAAPQASLNPGTVFKDCPDCPELVVIPAGSFTMGSSAAEQALANAAGLPAINTRRESPQHSVNIKSFAAGRYAVTKGEFANFVRARGYQTEAEKGDGCYGWTGKEWKKDKNYNWRNVGFTQADDHPVVCITWNDAQAYAQWISQASGKTYRLLSEAEREYATRAGTQTAFWWGDSINTSQANYNGNNSYNASPKGEYRQATVPVSSFSPNPFGLYNMHGNTWEWVEDCFHDTYGGAPTDGSAWATTCSNNIRVLRGGSWDIIPAVLRSATRLGNSPDFRINYFGFRLARTLFTP